MQDTTTDTAAFAAAWRRLRAAAPASREVRIILRRKSGQWAVTVGRITRTGTNETEAMEAVADALEDRP